MAGWSRTASSFRCAPLSYTAIRPGPLKFTRRTWVKVVAEPVPAAAVSMKCMEKEEAPSGYPKVSPVAFCTTRDDESGEELAARAAKRTVSTANAASRAKGTRLRRRIGLDANPAPPPLWL